tara:strand:- start:1397 stop:2212 length:816 start_codon:yes stop_codon:yes gene_type:complete
MNIAEMSMNSKVSLLKELYNDIASKGQDGDTMLAHINPYEAKLLKAHGGSGTINPTTGLPEFRSAVKSVVKVAKKVAPYAAVAAGAYYMAPAMTASIHTGIAGIAATGISASTALSVGSLAMQGYGAIQSKKYASQQSGYQRQQVEASNKADAARNRYNQLQQKRSRLVAIRQARIQQGQIAGSMGGTLGTGGTSGYLGSVGSIGTQASANVGNVNVAEGYGNTISNFNTQAANFGSKANSAGSKGTSWQNVGTLGGNLFAQGPQIANLFA